MSDARTRQTLKWLNGQPEHNEKDDECCPDFSCCVPSLFTEPLEERRRYLAALQDSEVDKDE